MSNIKRLPMPNDLMQMELKIANGADPNDIKGVERLWTYRMNCLLEDFGRREREFLEWAANQQKEDT